MATSVLDTAQISGRALPNRESEDPIKMKGRRLLPSAERCSLPMRSLNTRLMLSLTPHCPSQVILQDTLRRNSHLEQAGGHRENDGAGQILGPAAGGTTRQPKASNLKELHTGGTGAAILARLTKRNVGLICGSGKPQGI